MYGGQRYEEDLGFFFFNEKTDTHLEVNSRRFGLRGSLEARGQKTVSAVTYSDTGHGSDVSGKNLLYSRGGGGGSPTSREDTDSETKCLTRLTAGLCTLGSPRGAALSAQRAGRRQNIIPACTKSDVLLGKILEGF